MVPLHHALKNGERVEIIAAKQGGPSRDWLNPELGYAHSHRARTKVRQWFKAQQHEETLAQGRAIVERELARAGATAVSLDAVAVKAGFARPTSSMRPWGAPSSTRGRSSPRSRPSASRRRAEPKARRR
jgi:GTP pyrophosphokinase